MMNLPTGGTTAACSASLIVLNCPLESLDTTTLSPPKLPRLGAPLPTASSLCTHSGKPPPLVVVGRAVLEAAALPWAAEASTRQQATRAAATTDTEPIVLVIVL
jgi:hypothetical protein